MRPKIHRYFIRFAFSFSLVAASLAQTGDAPSSSDTSWFSLTSSLEKMHMAMVSVKPSGNSDVDFAAMMLPHHQAAIEMAKSELLNGKDPQMRRLAQEIITDQQSEIELMQLWGKQHSAHK